MWRLTRCLSPCRKFSLHVAGPNQVAGKCGHRFAFHRMRSIGLADAAARIVHAGPAALKTISRASFTSNTASGFRKADVASAPRLALQQIYTQRGRDLERSAAEVPSLQSLQEVEETLGYKFGNQWLLRLALLHTSAYPHTGSGNLAWLGDSALYLVVSEQLAATYSNAAMGDLTFARARLISGELCAERAKQMRLDDHVVLGKSVLSNIGQRRERLMAEIFEAVLGAVYIDGGLESVRALYARHYPLPDSIRHILNPPV